MIKILFGWGFLSYGSVPILSYEGASSNDNDSCQSDDMSHVSNKFLVINGSNGNQKFCNSSIYSSCSVDAITLSKQEASNNIKNRFMSSSKINKTKSLQKAIQETAEVLKTWDS